MDRQKIVAAVEAALSGVLGREVTGLTEDTRLFEDLFLDSTSVLELLVELEDVMGIDVDPEELDMNDFTSVRTLADYLEASAA